MIMHEDCLKGNYESIEKLRNSGPRINAVSQSRRVNWWLCTLSVNFLMIGWLPSVFILFLYMESTLKVISVHEFAYWLNSEDPYCKWNDLFDWHVRRMEGKEVKIIYACMHLLLFLGTFSVSIDIFKAEIAPGYPTYI